MFDTIFTFIMKSCTGPWCSRLSLAGVIVLSVWAVGHAGDTRVTKTEEEGHRATLSIQMGAVADEQTALRTEIEKVRREAKDANDAQIKRLERIEDLLIELLCEKRTPSARRP